MRQCTSRLLFSLARAQDELKDVYDAKYRFGQDDFHIEYLVTGPKKDYTHTTDYIRLS